MKEKIQVIISIFTRVVTAIFLFASIYNFSFSGLHACFEVADILLILLIGLISAVCYLPFLGDKIFSKVKMFLMQIIYFVIINSVVLTIGYFRNWFCFEQKSLFFAFESVIILVYAIVMIVSYKVDSEAAEKMNERLKNRT